MAEDKKYKGILYIILSAFCFAIMNTMVRLAGSALSTEEFLEI